MVGTATPAARTPGRAEPGSPDGERQCPRCPARKRRDRRFCPACRRALAQRLKRARADPKGGHYTKADPCPGPGAAAFAAGCLGNGRLGREPAPGAMRCRKCQAAWEIRREDAAKRRPGRGSRVLEDDRLWKDRLRKNTERLLRERDDARVAAKPRLRTVREQDHLGRLHTVTKIDLRAARHDPPGRP